MNGYHFSCRLTAARTVECWGRNSYGAVGDGTFVDRWTPTPVVGLRDVAGISAGDFHVCAWTFDGEVYWWGADAVALDDPSYFQNTPRIIAGLRDVVSVAAGKGASSPDCALTSAGRVWCWGSNQIAHPDDWDPEVWRTPTEVTNLPDAIAIDTGEEASCALLRDSTVRCWGVAPSWALGDPKTPMMVTVPLPLKKADGSVLSGVVELGMGWQQNCARLLSGDVLCGNVCSSATAGYRCSDYETLFLAFGPGYVPIKADGCFTQLSVFTYSLCARHSEGTVRCWGLNLYGQLGKGTPNPNHPFETSDVFGLRGVKEIATSTTHSCALFEDDSFRCWGSNKYGELGDGTNTPRYSPFP